MYFAFRHGFAHTSTSHFPGERKTIMQGRANNGALTSKSTLVFPFHQDIKRRLYQLAVASVTKTCRFTTQLQTLHNSSAQLHSAPQQLDDARKQAQMTRMIKVLLSRPPSWNITHTTATALHWSATSSFPVSCGMAVKMALLVSRSGLRVLFRCPQELSKVEL